MSLDVDDASEGEATPSRNTLGTIRGVFLPVYFSIFGVILYTRWGWVVGNAGVYETLAIICLGETVSILTMCSLSALCTNGKVRGGGSYFMISRSLGPEFGGSLGIIFYLANILNNAQYLATIATTIFGLAAWDEQADYLLVVAVRSGVLLVAAIICYIGAEAYTKTLNVVVVIFCVSNLLGVLSFFIPRELSLDQGLSFTGPNWRTFSNALTPTYEGYLECPDNDPGPTKFWAVFAVAFNGMTGINAGANMSGDLADPARSIPLGSFAGLAVSIVTYVIAVFGMASSTPTQALHCDYNIMTTVCVWPPLVYSGILIAMFASTLSSITGAARILQALARDDIFPGLAFFAAGTRKGDEPRRGVILSWVLTQGLVFVPSLNVVATITSFFFLLSYTITNFACFLHSVTGAPNFRPTFRFFSWPGALLGTLLCLALMILINALTALISVLVFALLFIFINWRNPAVTSWGDVTQAVIFHQVRKYLLKMDFRKEHVKYWRPSVMLLTKNPKDSLPLVKFCDDLKKGGLYIIGTIFVGDRESKGSEVREAQGAYLDFIANHGIKAFPEVVLTPSVRVGVQTLLLASGLGQMKPNTVVLGFPELAEDEESHCGDDSHVHKSARLELISPNQHSRNLRQTHTYRNPVTYVELLLDCSFFGKNIVLARNFANLDRERIVKAKADFEARRAPRRMSIDMWLLRWWLVDGKWRETTNTITLMLQLGWILSRSSSWKGLVDLRVLTVAEAEDEIPDLTDRVCQMLKECRIPATVTVIPLPTAAPSDDLTLLEKHDLLRSVIRDSCSLTAVVFSTVAPPPPNSQDAREYLELLDRLSVGLPPFLMVQGTEHTIADEL